MSNPPPAPALIVKPVILETDGVFGQLRDGAITNIGGTINPTFTVNGRSLLFSDGSSTSGGSGALNLQSVYDNTPIINGAANINLSTNKNFTINDATDGVFFSINSQTGAVTITGDLIVNGTHSVINSTVTDSDHWLISPNAGTTTALRIEPDLNVTPIVDLVSIRNAFAGAPVFRIDAGGNIASTKNFSITGLINGINIVDLNALVANHLAGVAGYRHPATAIDITPIPSLSATATNVQQALEALNTKVTANSTSSNVRGFEHIEGAAAVTWTITHNLSSFRVQTTVYDDTFEVVIPNHIKILDNNTISISFTSAISGRAMILAF
jgi:hypothetical protein